MPQDNQNPSFQTPPPVGDARQAEKYVDQLADLINQEKLKVTQTDLSKFNPSNLEFHFRMELRDYSIEVSHTKYPQSVKDNYNLIFTNAKQLQNGTANKVILAYFHLAEDQFAKLKTSATQQIARIKRAEEEKRLKEALAPIDQALENITYPKEETPAVEDTDHQLTISSDIYLTPLSQHTPAELPN